MEPKPFVELHTFSVSYWWSVTDIAFYFSDITVTVYSDLILGGGGGTGHFFLLTLHNSINNGGEGRRVHLLRGPCLIPDISKQWIS